MHTLPKENLQVVTNKQAHLKYRICNNRMIMHSTPASILTKFSPPLARKNNKQILSGDACRQELPNRETLKSLSQCLTPESTFHYPDMTTLFLIFFPLHFEEKNLLLTFIVVYWHTTLFIVVLLGTIAFVVH